MVAGLGDVVVGDLEGTSSGCEAGTSGKEASGDMDGTHGKHDCGNVEGTAGRCSSNG